MRRGYPEFFVACKAQHVGFSKQDLTLKKGKGIVLWQKYNGETIWLLLNWLFLPDPGQQIHLQCFSVSGILSVFVLFFKQKM